MAGGLNKKQLAVAKKDAAAAINVYKAEVKEKIRELRGISTLLMSAHRAYREADEQNNKKPSGKNDKKLVRAYDSYKYALDNYKAAKQNINAKFALVENEYGKLIEINRMQGNLKGADRAGAEYEEYSIVYKRLLEKSDKVDVLEIDLGEEYCEPKVEEISEDVPEIPAPLTPKDITSAVTSVNVAPVTIDVTSIVERAISSAIDKLSEGLNRKLEAYVNSINVPAPSAAPTVAAANNDNGEAVSTLEVLVGEERDIVDRLKELCASITELIGEVGNVANECRTISQKQMELAELQKQINDIQRHTAREQQGVQVNQRLVSEEQVELIAAQTLVLDGQKQLAERQAEVARVYSEVMEKQGEIDEAMRSVAVGNAAILSAQNALIATNEKQLVTVNELKERNVEILNEHKEALSVVKKLAREQAKVALNSGNTKKTVQKAKKEPAEPPYSAENEKSDTAPDVRELEINR